MLSSLIHSFIHSGQFYSAPSSPLLLRGAPDYSTDTVSKFHSEAHRQLQVQDLHKVPTIQYNTNQIYNARKVTPKCESEARKTYVAARAGVEPTTHRLKVIVSTKAPPRPTNIRAIISLSAYLSVFLAICHVGFPRSICLSVDRSIDSSD